MKCSKIGEQIGILRNKRGLSQDELGRALNENRNKIDHWERGDRQIKADDIVKLADFFEVSCDELLTGTKPENTTIVRELGLSNKASDILKKQKDSLVPGVLSQIIEHRLFVPLIRNIGIWCKPQEEFSKMFSSAVRLHLANDLPYVDSPDDLRAVYKYSLIRQFERIVDSIIDEGKCNSNEKGKR